MLIGDKVCRHFNRISDSLITCQPQNDVVGKKEVTLTIARQTVHIPKEDSLFRSICTAGHYKSKNGFCLTCPAVSYQLSSLFFFPLTFLLVMLNSFFFLSFLKGSSCAGGDFLPIANQYWFQISYDQFVRCNPPEVLQGAIDLRPFIFINPFSTHFSPRTVFFFYGS